MLFLALVGAGQPVEQPFKGGDQRREERSLAFIYTRHVAAERSHKKKNDPAKEKDLDPAVEGHGLSTFAIMNWPPSEMFRTDERVDEVDEQQDRDAPAKNVIERHVKAPRGGRRPSCRQRGARTRRRSRLSR